jgi:hypothetical protein
MNDENHVKAAPVHRLVGQLRALLAKATPGPWEEVCAASRKHVCILEVSGGTPPGGQYSPPRRWKIVGKTRPHAPTDQDANAAIIVAAVNALPALLAIAEAAAVVSLQRNGPYLMADMDATLKAESDLRTALSLLPNSTMDSEGPMNQDKAMTDYTITEILNAHEKRLESLEDRTSAIAEIQRDDHEKGMAGRISALEKQVEQIHAWDDAHAKGHDAGDTAMCGRVEALEVGLAQLGVTVAPVMVDGRPLVMPKPAPVDAGQKEDQPWRGLPALPDDKESNSTTDSAGHTRIDSAGPMDQEAKP